MGAEEHYCEGNKEYPIGAFAEDEHREDNADKWALCDISLHFLHKLEKKCLLLQRILWLYTKWRFGSVAQLDRATAF